MRIDHWKIFAGYVLVDATRLTMTSGRGVRQVARIQSARVLDLHIVKHKRGSKLRRIQPTSKSHKRANSPVNSVIVTKILSQEMSRDKEFFIRLRQSLFNKN